MTQPKERKRRGHSEGTIFKRRDGRWSGSVTLGYEGEKRIRKTVYGRTRREVADKLAAVQEAARSGLPATNDTITVARFAADWLDSVRHSVKHSTWRRYEQLIRVHAAPALGKIKLSRLTPGHIQKLYADKLASGMSPQSVRHLHRVIHTMLEQAVKWGNVPRNVAKVVDRPRVSHRDMQIMDAAQVRRFLATSEGTRLEALWWLACETGMRAGEMLALKWTDVDIDASAVRVRATLQRYGAGYILSEPKTARSRRVIAISPATAQKLREHRSRQLEERLRLGPAWQDEGFVFTNTVGQPLDSGNVLARDFRPLLRAAGLPETLRVHDLRHTAISLALSKGVAPTDVAEMAGHSSVAVTLTRYAHALPGAPGRATSAIAAAIAAD